MNRQKNPAIGVLFFIGFLFFVFSSSGAGFFLIPLLIPIIFFFVIFQFISAAKKYQQTTGTAGAKRPVDNRFDTDFSIADKYTEETGTGQNRCAKSNQLWKCQ
jgi:hypothetical protein